MQQAGRREQQKQARRARLLEVARRALERGDFSMRRLAEDAGMAEVTPYNLFGSKRGVLEALYAVLRRESEQRLAAMRRPDPLARVFDAIDLLADDIAAAPGFYRALFGALFERPAARGSSSPRPPRRAGCARTRAATCSPAASSTCWAAPCSTGLRGASRRRNGAR
jgi:AcrR family transcriptional regulator